MSRRMHLLLAVCLTTIANAQVLNARPFSEMVVFDASQSNASGRPSNGLLWTEWLASQLNIPTAEESGLSDRVVFVNDLEPAVTNYLSAHTPHDGSLIVLGNLGPNQGMTYIEYWTEMSRQVSRLAENGARNFIINRVDYLGYSQRFPHFRDIIREQNEIGDPILQQLATDLDIAIHRPSPDGFAGFTSVLEEPSAFGFVNVADPITSAANPHEYVWRDDAHLTTAAHRLLALDIFRALDMSIEPTKTQLHGRDDSYVQNFDTTLDGLNSRLPDGWVGVTNGAAYSSITGTFSNRIGAGGTLYDVGPRRSEDRALAMGVTDSTEKNEIQFQATVTESDMRQIRLEFDIETWGVNKDLATDPGEAAFDVTIEADSGAGFTNVLELGMVGTTIRPPEQKSQIDGNATENRVSFDSGVYPFNVSPGATLRVRWQAADNTKSNHYVFGLDNVVLSTVFAGDFNDNGLLGVEDVDLLSTHVSSGGDGTFDLTGDGTATVADVDRLLQLANRSNGDADFDGQVAFSDFLILADNFGQLDKKWSEGDFDSSGGVEFPDFLILANSFGVAADAVTSVPEPSGAVFAWLTVCGLCFRRREIRRSE